ncbi:MAG: peptidase S41 [Micavibrio aeruginosavorus]|uniref:Peptidase S41 n=1 Tax=Micavibrio aeruginosavorus TaxID=349221 RepID=A0A2W5MUA4_9BACT|nr:MAG: peptidase S41 [Micavibrio aeruginosavorus]
MRHLSRIVLSLGLVSALALSSALPAIAQEEPRTAGAEKKADTDPDANNTYKQLNLFGEVFERVRANYVDPVSDKQLIEYALTGMLSNLDPHSSYLTEKDFSDMQVQTKGEFGGLGIEVTMDSGFVKVVSPIDDTPAFKAGVLAGDYITHINDEPVMGTTLNDAVEKMRGKVGTSVKITIRREGVDEALNFNIKRDVIRIKSVRYHVEQGNVGYIRVTTFNQNTVEGVEAAITDIKKQVKSEKLLGYVLDLRNNPGGLLDQAIGLSDLFLDKGEIVSTRGRSEEDTKRDNATPGDMADGKPMVVLINGGSASASEIVSGALQDHRRAILLGTKSFGKGSVQTVIPLPGNGAMRLTTARYFTPSGRSIQAKGIDPDIVVEQAKIEKISSAEDVHEADLKGALKNPDAKTAPAPEVKKVITDPPPEKSGSGEAKKIGDKEEAEQQDYQLSRAIDLIRGVSMYEGRRGTN